MTSPIPQVAIKAAAEAITKASNVFPDFLVFQVEEFVDDARVALEAALPIIWAQINVTKLAGVIADHGSLTHLPDTGSECECGELVAGADDDHPYQSWRLHAAQAVIAHLAEKDKK